MKFLLSLVCIVSFAAVAEAGPLRDWVNSWRPGVIVPLPSYYSPRPCPCPPGFCPCPSPGQFVQPIPAPIYLYPPPRHPSPCPGGQCPLPRPAPKVYTVLPVGPATVLGTSPER